jgi:hypothetical protein
MERGDIAAVAIGLLLVILLTALLSLPGRPSPQAPAAVTATPIPSPPATPVPETTERPTPETPAPPPVTARRISYTDDYHLLPVRFLPDDMSMYGFSDVDWQYNRTVVFAYVEESHGGITETFTVPYPMWRLTSTLPATESPERARFRMILVDEESGQILEGTEIHFPGRVTRTVAAKGRPLYMVIETEGIGQFSITLEAPAVFVQ